MIRGLGISGTRNQRSERQYDGRGGSLLTINHNTIINRSFTAVGPIHTFHDNTRLHQSKDSDDDETTKDDDAKKDTIPSNNSDDNQAFYNLFLAKINATLPLSLIRLYRLKFNTVFPTLRIALTSFLIGAAIAFAAVLVPVYNSVDKMTEPVTLFETILADLDRGYVDTIDTNKLFETGVSAMLSSLDPYTEFEGKTEAAELNESVNGKYGGIGLVISGAVPKKLESADKAVVTPVSQNVGGSGGDVDGVGGSGGGSPLLPQDALDEKVRLNDRNAILNGDDDDEDLLLDGSYTDEEAIQQRKEQKKRLQKAREQGIRVISAMEGYAYDYGMRPGDKIVAVDGKRFSPDESVENVRNMLRGDPGSKVAITIQRVGIEGETTLDITRALVQMRDVKLTTLLGKEKDGIGYIQLTGFTANSGRDVRNSIFALQKAAEEVSEGGLKGLILDLRGNPGGLLTSAVDVSSLFVPKGSEIVSARGRGFPGVRYISRVDPIVDPSTKVAVLINGGTASAAEIVSGALQDLDVGVIVGSERTFGKGLVQNVADLPFDTALKFTVAKYYTPSGRCIQSTNYREGGESSKVADRDKTTFFTTNGREVKDGGGIAADLKVDSPQASALEVTLLRSGSMSDFAAEWSKDHQLTDSFNVDGRTYQDFQNFVMAKQKNGDIKLDALYSAPIDQLKKTLKQSGYSGATKEVKLLEASIVREMRGDFEKYSEDIKEDIGQSILARYIPDSMLRERTIKTDKQVIAAVKLISNEKQYDKLLGRTLTNTISPSTTLASSSTSSNNKGGSVVTDTERESPVSINLKF